MKIRKVFGKCVSALFVLSMVFGSALTVHAEEPKAETKVVIDNMEVEPAHFFVRVDGVEQKENGKTHYKAKYYTQDVVTRQLKEYKAINANGKTNAEGKFEADQETLDAIIENIIAGEEGIPTAEDFTFAEAEIQNNRDKYEVKWYVIKKESDFWHVDGVLVKKAVAEKPEVEPEKPEVEPERPEVEPEKPEVEPEKPEVEPEKPEVEPEEPEVELEEDDDTEVLGEVFENPDTDEETEVLGDVFENPGTDEETAVLGAEFAATGDKMPLFVIVALFVMSGLGIAVLTFRKREF